jgi:signal transduction histidine kinase
MRGKKKMTNQPLWAQVQPELKGAILRSPVLRSPARLFFIVTISIMVAGIAIMFLFELLPPMPPLVKNIADGALLTVLLFPVLYLFLFQSLRMRADALQQAEESRGMQNGKQAGQVKGQNDIRRSPARLLFVVAISIMVAETAIMFLIEQLPSMSPRAENFTDGILLAILISPILYLFMFRPLRGHVFALGQAEKSLRQQNEELKEKTRQLLAAQDELVRNEKLAVLGQIAGSVGHELRNPLGVISNAVFFLQTVLADAGDNVKEYLDIIKSEIAGSERIVSDLLDSVRTKLPHPEIVGLRELLEKTLGKCAVPSTVTVKLDIPDTLSSLRVDSQQIHQVFRNLISNGMEAMPEGGTLETQASEDAQAKTINIRVKDSGIGMTPEQFGKLFQPLFTTKARGIGLGLVVVKNLTQANGGSVGVESAPGKGSVFTVTLPCGS